MVTFRKNRRTGRWVVVGPAEEVREGTVKVHKRDGSTTEVLVVGISAPFDKEGVPHVFGYIEYPGMPTRKPREQQVPEDSPPPAPRTRVRIREFCPECGENVLESRFCWETGARH